MVHPRFDGFCAIFNNIEKNHESGENDLNVYQKACVEYLVLHEHAFTLEQCWEILREHLAWKEVEMPAFQKPKKGRKKSKTSETTSDGGFNLNEETCKSEEETREERPIGCDQSKKNKKKSSTSDQFKASFTNMVADKFVNLKSLKWGKKKSETDEYFQLKKREKDVMFYNSAIDHSLPLIQ